MRRTFIALLIALLAPLAAAQSAPSLQYEVHVRTEASDEVAVWTVHHDSDLAWTVQPGYPEGREHAWAVTGPAVDHVPHLLEHERRLRAPLWEPLEEEDVVGLASEPIFGRTETYTGLEWSLERGTEDRTIDGAAVEHWVLTGWLQTTVSDEGGDVSPLEQQQVNSVEADVLVRPDLPFSNAPLAVWGSAASLNARVPDAFLAARITETLKDVGLPVRIEATLNLDDVSVARATWIEGIREVPAPEDAPDVLDYERVPGP